MSTPARDLAALDAIKDKLTSSERIWADRITIRWNDPKGQVITSREWERVRALTEEARQR